MPRFLALSLSVALIFPLFPSRADPTGPRCQPPAGVSGNPKTISEAVALLNRLPKPTSVACFVEALERPLQIQATSSRISAQPAQGARSPRVFIVKENFIIAVVASDDPEPVVEFSEILNPTASIKGELAFPVLDVLPTSAPFTSILIGDGTSCRGCHGTEQAIPYPAADTTAYASRVFSPDPRFEVTVPKMIELARECDPSTEPSRCAILQAIVGDSTDVSRGTF